MLEHKEETTAETAPEEQFPRPQLKLIGRDGNAYAILGAARRAWMKAKLPKERWGMIQKIATSGDYYHLLGTIQKYFDVD